MQGGTESENPRGSSRVGQDPSWARVGWAGSESWGLVETQHLIWPNWRNWERFEGCFEFCGGFGGREMGLVWRDGGLGEEGPSCAFVREWMRLGRQAGFVWFGFSKWEKLLKLKMVWGGEGEICEEAFEFSVLWSVLLQMVLGSHVFNVVRIIGWAG